MKEQIYITIVIKIRNVHVVCTINSEVGQHTDGRRISWAQPLHRDQIERNIIHEINTLKHRKLYGTAQSTQYGKIPDSNPKREEKRGTISID